MYTIAVCDEDGRAQRSIGKLLEENFKQKIRILFFHNYGELTDAVINGGQYFDGLFIDIQYPESNGMEAIRLIRTKLSDIAVVYMAEHFDNCEKIFETEACFLLKKPVNYERIAAAIAKVEEKIEKKKARKLVVKLSAAEEVVLKAEDIIYVESVGHKMHIHTSDKIYETYEKLNNLQCKLGSSFVRSHKSFLINMNYIKSRNKASFTLTTGENIVISRIKVNEVKKMFWDYFE